MLDANTSNLRVQRSLDDSVEDIVPMFTARKTGSRIKKLLACARTESVAIK